MRPHPHLNKSRYPIYATVLVSSALIVMLSVMVATCAGTRGRGGLRTDGSSQTSDSALVQKDSVAEVPDSDGDGISDEQEGKNAPGGAPDTDGDGAPDYNDLDSDNDGIPDAIEGGPSNGTLDSDGDSIPDFRDPDSDNDSWNDGDEGQEDSDGDGIPNWLDPRNDVSEVTITLKAISVAFNNPIGIDYHEPTNSVILTANYPTGSPHNFERVDFEGTYYSFSDISGLTDEIKIAAARSSNLAAGFVLGDLFVGNGTDGQIVRVTGNGETVIDPWVDLPGENNGLLRGSFTFDETGQFDGDLIAVTTRGQVWRINSNGEPTLIAATPTAVHLEGVAIVPNSEVRFGPLAGKIIAGAEEEGKLYSFSKDGGTSVLDVGVKVEDVDLIRPNENFFGINFGTGRILGVSAAEFAPIAGDILLTQEHFDANDNIGLYRLYWNGTNIVADPLIAHSDSAAIDQWEHVTFAPAGIVEIEPIR